MKKSTGTFLKEFAVWTIVLGLAICSVGFCEIGGAYQWLAEELGLR